MYVDDLADACLFLMDSYDGKGLVNVGTGEEVTIKELAETVADVTGFKGRIVFNTEKPDGTPRKLMDSSRIKEAGWKYTISLKEGLQRAYQFYQKEMQLAD
jgi:GDP-L-fucose synthase